MTSWPCATNSRTTTTEAAGLVVRGTPSQRANRQALGIRLASRQDYLDGTNITVESIGSLRTIGVSTACSNQQAKPLRRLCATLEDAVLFKWRGFSATGSGDRFHP